MEAGAFEVALKNAVNTLNFVENIDLSVEQSIVDGKIFLQYACFVKEVV
jgi:hypothetical protein